MDPKANLARQLEIAARLDELAAMPAPAGKDCLPEAIEACRLAWELAELVQALNEWLTNGGFSPWEERDTGAPIRQLVTEVFPA